jgi:glycosyltransferase involved in cell wall biosynthesis
MSPLSLPNILYITYDGLTDQLGQSQILPYLTGLSSNYTITVLSCDKPERLKRFRLETAAACKKANITWVPVPYLASDSGWTAIPNFFRLKKKCFEIAGKSNFSLIHCRSYLPALIAHSLKEKYGIPYLFDMRGLWPDERVDGNSWNLQNPIYKKVYQYFKKKEKILFSEAGHIVSLTEKAIPVINNICGNTFNNISVIPCAADFEKFQVGATSIINTKKSKLEINPDDKILCYLGSTGTWYMLDEMLRFFNQFLKVFPDSIFLIITNDNHSQLIDRIARTETPPSRIRVTAANREDVPDYLSIVDFGISFIKASFSKQASSPTKLAEFLAMGIPVICNNIGDVKEQIEYIKGGVIVGDFSNNALLETCNNLVIHNFNKTEIRNRAKEIFEVSLAVKKYSDIYAELIKSSQ